MKLSQDQFYQLQDQYERTPQPDECIVSGEHYQLIALLNGLGCYPSSREEAISTAERILTNGYTS